MGKNEDEDFKLSVRPGSLVLLLNFLKQTSACLVIKSYGSCLSYCSRACDLQLNTALPGNPSWKETMSGLAGREGQVLLVLPSKCSHFSITSPLPTS